MAFDDFTFPRVQQDLGLTIDAADLYSDVPAVPVREELASMIVEGTNLALAINTEKAKSEFIIAPLLTIVEAKDDNLFNGLGQCIASMGAADLFNQKSGRPIPVIHGVVTTGSAWKFLRLRDSTVTLDLKENYIDDPGKILGVLESLVRSS